jgi:hypothetical protein
VSKALATLAVVTTLLGPAIGASAAKAPKSTTTTVKSTNECAATQLSFSGPGAVSAQLGEDAFTITLTNVSTQTCQIHGYPTVRFYTSAGRLLTFSYSHQSQYFRRRAPRLVTLVPRGRAYFLVAKYRCDLGIRYSSSFFYLLAPYTTGAPSVEHAVGNHGDGVGPGVMDYCKGSSRGPGQTLGITPIVSTRAQLFS